jgi:peptidoglycan/xylan/chitin deacetylase (PgdA/CDA1 family)
MKRIFAGNRSASVPILMYHSISENLFGKAHPYYQINTSPKIFAQQMNWLHANGYRTMNLTESYSALCTAADVSKTVVITFDDGYRDFYTDAFAVMQKCGFTATIFIATDRIQDRSLRFDGADYLTWSEVRELHNAGITFGSHTVSHPILRSLQPAQIDHELGHSKQIIEQQLGAPVLSFAYPYAFPEEDKPFTRFLTDLLEKHGYSNGVSTIIGLARARHHRFFLPRLPINSWDDPAFLRAKLAGAYDWLHWPQRLSKSLRRKPPVTQQSAWTLNAAGPSDSPKSS